jgi:hypothetical protein
MKSWHVALIGGTGASAIVLTFLILQKKREFEVESNRMRTQLTSDIARGEYRTQLDALRAQLSAYAEVVANQAADAHLINTYGLTPERMAGLRRLAAMFGG